MTNVSQATGIDIIDLSSAQDVPEFEMLRWNLNETLSRIRPRLETGFDLINSRFLADGVNTDRWPSLVRECWRLLAPGGWLQMVEPVWQFQSDIGEVLPCLEAWWNHYSDALRLMRKEARVGRSLFGHLRVAGFQSIQFEDNNIPAAGWRDGMSDSAHVVLVIGMRD